MNNFEFSALEDKVTLTLTNNCSPMPRFKAFPIIQVANASPGSSGKHYRLILNRNVSFGVKTLDFKIAGVSLIFQK